MTPKPRRAREGQAEALAQIPQEELVRDSQDLTVFRDAPNEWDETEWQWPDTPAEEKV